MNWRFWSRHPHSDSEPDSCTAIEPLLSLYSDGMASPSEARRVDAHLTACPDCLRALQWMQATHMVIAQRPAVEPPANMRARIAIAIAEAEHASRPARPIRRPLLLRPAFAGALGVCAMVGAGLMLSHEIAPPSVVTAVSPVPTVTAPRSAPPVTHPAAPRVATNTAPAIKKSQAHPSAPLKRFAKLPQAVKPPTLSALRVPRKTLTAKAPPSPDTKTPVLIKPLVKHDTLTAHASMRSIFHAAKPPLLALRQHDQPAILTPIRPHWDKSLQVARVPVGPPLGSHTGDGMTPAVPSTPNVQVAKVDSHSLTHSEQQDIMRPVLARLGSFQSSDQSRKVYLDSSARVRNATMAASTQFVQESIVHSPGF